MSLQLSPGRERGSLPPISPDSAPLWEGAWSPAGLAAQGCFLFTQGSQGCRPVSLGGAYPHLVRVRASGGLRTPPAPCELHPPLGLSLAAPPSLRQRQALLEEIAFAPIGTLRQVTESSGFSLLLETGPPGHTTTARGLPAWPRGLGWRCHPFQTEPRFPVGTGPCGPFPHFHCLPPTPAPPAS